MPNSLSATVRSAETRTTDGETRRAIMAAMLRAGAITASQLGKDLELAPTGIRRHLDNLVEEGLAEPVPYKVATSGRGRPAKKFRLTDAGRGVFGHEYDSLAVQALTTLKETAGDEAVRAFAKKRAAAIVAGIKPGEDRSLEQIASALVEAFQQHGYAATLTKAGHGVQLCQHHCPIATVATQFPELCAAEQEIIAELLGHHVQPLASIALGDGICTTNIPIHPINTSKKGAVHDSSTNKSQPSH